MINQYSISLENWDDDDRCSFFGCRHDGIEVIYRWDGQQGKLALRNTQGNTILRVDMTGIAIDANSIEISYPNSIIPKPEET